MAINSLKLGSSVSPQSPSQVVKETAAKFIDHFSRTDLSDSVGSKAASLLSVEELSQVKKEALAVASLLKNPSPSEGDAQGSFYFLNKGKHNVVWGHLDFPSIVVKLMSCEAASKQVLVAERARAFAKEQNPFWCRIPLSTCIEVPEMLAAGEPRALYIEERLPLGMDWSGHREFWARVFTHSQSAECLPIFKENLVKLVSQMASLIVNIGIWDVGLKNFPEVSMDGKYVCAVDFENVDLDKKSVYDGLQRLASLFPLPLFRSTLWEAYQRVGIASEMAYNQKFREENKESWQRTSEHLGCKYEMAPLKTVESCTQAWDVMVKRKQKEVQTLQEALIVYDTKGLTSGGIESLPAVFEIGNSTEEEVVLAQYVLSKMQEKITLYGNSGISEKRIVGLQPKGVNECYTRERFVNALNELKRQGLLINWFDDERTAYYTIRF